jgi:GxxExxY protein
MELQSVLAHGFLEAVYQDALEQELLSRRIPFFRERSIPVLYKGLQLSTPYRADFVCYDAIIVELKAIKKLTEIDDAQMLHYLYGTGFERGLLFNFATPQLEYKRFIQ